MKKGNIIVGMSGGVDSSVTAWLLQEQGYNVSGLFMKNWEEDDTDQYCSAAIDMADAQAVCDRLNIPLHKVNFASEYWIMFFPISSQNIQPAAHPILIFYVINILNLKLS